MALQIFCRRIRVSNPAMLKSKGPLLLAVNHPNSFLDAIVMDILFRQPVWSLARGDAFKNKGYAKILAALKMLPVYRVSEGVENLDENYKTFNDCKEIFRRHGTVLIFSEGKCINEWHLRPLKKGTARLAYSSWADDIPLQVLPIGINYSSFSVLGKNVFLNTGNIITKNDFPPNLPDGKTNALFNERLKAELENLVFEIPPGNKKMQREKLYIPVPIFRRWLLFLPALAGWLLNAPFYFPIHFFIWKKTKGIDHYDSVMLGMLAFFYPFYLFLLTGLLFLFSNTWWALAILVITPLSAKAFIEIKKQLD